MHELGLCEAVLSAAEKAVGKQGAGQQVSAIRVRIGALHRVSQAAFGSAFEMIAAGSVAEGAEVTLVVIPIRVHCLACGQDSSADDLLGACPACGAPEVDSDGGDEVLIDDIVVGESTSLTASVGDTGTDVRPGSNNGDDGRN